jgi:tetratricopeptide (TPR) repeat protein
LKNLNKLDEAIESFNESIQINPVDSLAFYIKGIALHKLNKLKGSIECYDKAIQFNSNYALA